MSKSITLTYYSDVLCIWAYIAQARVDKVLENFPEQVSIDYRFCSVFGDTKHKIGEGWADRGGYTAYGKHVQEIASGFDYINVHPDLWLSTRPTSSTPAHLLLKAVQHIEPSKFKAVLTELRHSFFERNLDISRRAVLLGVLEAAGVSAKDIQEVIDCGEAHAELEADHRNQQQLMVLGSPTYILNEGRQKLFGNVGYGVIEANIKELLRSPVAGSASWC